MIGGGSSVENGFNPDIFSTRRIVVGPLLAFLGFLLLAFAILVDTEELKKKFISKRPSGLKPSSSSHKAASANVTPVTMNKKENNGVA